MIETTPPWSFEHEVREALGTRGLSTERAGDSSWESIFGRGGGAHVFDVGFAVAQLEELSRPRQSRALPPGGVYAPPVSLRGERVQLRRGEAGDSAQLTTILREPEISARWGAFTDEEVIDQFVDSDLAFVITVDDEVIGAIQYEENEDPMYRSAGVDIFIATSWQGRGHGTDAIRTLARHLIEERGHHRLTIDPAADNLRAIRAYERVGFRTVGVMRMYERGPDGTWHDGLLMEMLAGELRDDEIEGEGW
jgi:aminoglycoside 6'-N-acetyltransferase